MQKVAQIVCLVLLNNLLVLGIVTSYLGKSTESSECEEVVSIAHECEEVESIAHDIVVGFVVGIASLFILIIVIFRVKNRGYFKSSYLKTVYGQVKLRLNQAKLTRNQGISENSSDGSRQPS